MTVVLTLRDPMPKEIPLKNFIQFDTLSILAGLPSYCWLRETIMEDSMWSRDFMS